MSTLARLAARLRNLLQPAQNTPYPDEMITRDWADLPAYHPRCD